MSKANTESLPSEATLAFAHSHLADDLPRLLLAAGRYPEVDMRAVACQIEGIRTAQRKWPSLLRCASFVYPPRLNCEQSSSEATAAYKASLLGHCRRAADLTGGMGIDTLALSAKAAEMHYVELSPMLSSLFGHNLEMLRQSGQSGGNIVVHQADSIAWLASQSPFDLLLIDPARRDSSGHKVVAFADCSPDLLAALPLLLASTQMLMVKASPMIDIDLAISQLGCVADVHVVAVGGECREVLFLCAAGHLAPPLIHCINLAPSYPNTPAPPNPSVAPFTRATEAAAPLNLASTVDSYLYLPSADLLKGGCFRLISMQYNILPLAPSTHIYTSPHLLPYFPGRAFRVLRELKLARSSIREAIPDGRAHVVSRNHPLSAPDIQHRFGLKEGGDRYLVAATVGTRPCAYLCQLVGTPSAGVAQ